MDAISVEIFREKGQMLKHLPLFLAVRLSFYFRVGEEIAYRFVIIDAADRFGEDGGNRKGLDFAI